MPALPFDEIVSRRIEALYRSDDAVRRRRAVLDAVAPVRGERVLDVGTGPGFLALEAADRVGPSGSVVAIDASEAMLALARARCAERPCVELRLGDARELPVEDGAFDVAISVQVYEYVADVEAAIAEMRRALRAGGRGAIVSTDWRSIAWRSSDRERMDRVLAAFAEHCPHQDLPLTLSTMLRDQGLAIRSRIVLPQFNPVYVPGGFSAGLVPLVASFAAGRRGVTSQEARAWAEDLIALGERDDYFFCLNQYLFVVEKPAV